MKLKLISIFLISQIIELGLFWLIANGNLNVFLALVGVDLILTSIFCSEQIKEFISILTNEEHS